MSDKIMIEKFKFDEFRLDKSSIETHDIWNKDGENAKECIQTFVEFN